MTSLVLSLVLGLTSVSLVGTELVTQGTSSQPAAAASELTAPVQTTSQTPSEQPSTVDSASTELSRITPAPKENSDQHTFFLLGGGGLLFLIGIGSVLGAKGTLVIYSSWFDFGLSVTLLGLAFVRIPYVQILTGLLFLLSIELSCRSNSSLVKLLLVFPAKFGLPVLALLSGFLALGLLKRLLGGKLGDKETQENVMIGVTCAAAFLYLSKFIKQLIETQTTRLQEAEPLAPANE